MIDRVPNVDMDATRRDQIVGEAKFLRALHYYWQWQQLVGWKDMTRSSPLPTGPAWITRTGRGSPGRPCSILQAASHPKQPMQREASTSHMCLLA